MAEYGENDRNKDFDFFIQNYQKLFKHYGYKFIAIRNEKILGAFDSVIEAIKCLSANYKLGDYIIQECDGDDRAYKSKIIRLMIDG